MLNCATSTSLCRFEGPGLTNITELVTMQLRWPGCGGPGLPPQRDAGVLASHVPETLVLQVMLGSARGETVELKHFCHVSMHACR